MNDTGVGLLRTNCRSCEGESFYSIGFLGMCGCGHVCLWACAVDAGMYVYGHVQWMWACMSMGMCSECEHVQWMWACAVNVSMCSGCGHVVGMCSGCGI